MENYEKRYKELINALQEARNDESKKGYTFCSVIDSIVPQLAESEDEQFRKYILKCCEETIIADDKGLELSMATTKRLKAWLEKQREQKPVEAITDGLNTEFQKQVSYLIASVMNREYEYSQGYVNWVAQSLLGYAKNELEQEPVEWSEEDEVRYYSCLQQLGTGNPSQPETINSKWFREHIYPRPHWKPSEEQMNALWSATEKYLESDDENVRKLRGEVLESLYEDLKKLKEE